MDPELVRARGRLYTLLGRLLLDGPVPEVRARLAALPALAGDLPGGDDDAAMAEHHRVLAHEVFPYESVFLGPEAQLGGALAAQVRDACDRSGLPERRADVEPDHLGLELVNLGWLSAAGADALEDDETAIAGRIGGMARAFLDQHLLRWLPAAVIAVRTTGAPLYTTAAELALELAVAHRAELAGEMPSWSLPEPPELLDDPRTGLKRVARHLLVPARSGVFLSRSAIDALAAAIDVPRGFGGRLKTLESLLFGAVDHERAPELLGALDEMLAEAARAHAGLADLGAPTAPWQERIAATRRMVARLAEGARTGTAPPEPAS